MTHPAIPVALIALAVPAAASAGDDLGRVQLAQLTIHERIIIRVPRMSPLRPTGRTPMAPPARWKHRKGPKCIAAANLGGAMIGPSDTVDLVLSGGRRVRAKLDGDCGPLDFYSGFYLRPAGDGQVCAGRDVIRMRSGLSCTIKTFRTLYPAR